MIVFLFFFGCRGQGGRGVGRKRACVICVFCASSTVFYRLESGRVELD